MPGWLSFPVEQATPIDEIPRARAVAVTLHSDTCGPHTWRLAYRDGMSEGQVDALVRRIKYLAAHHRGRFWEYSSPDVPPL